MKIQAVNAYLSLMRAGSVPVIFCGNDRDHTLPLVSIDEKDDLTLYCLGCQWRQSISLNMYESMINILIMHDPEWIGYGETE